MFQKILIKTAQIFLVSALVFLNISFWHSALIGWCSILIYCLLVSGELEIILQHVFDLTENKLIVRVISGFVVVSFLGSLAVIPINFYKLSGSVVSIIFFAVGMIFLVVRMCLDKSASSTSVNVETQNFASLQGGRTKIGIALAYVATFFVSFYLLYLSRTGKGFFNPWEVINSWYLVVFLLGTFLLGILIITKLNPKLVMFLIVLHALLLHSYLPLTHKLVYGPDGWRHMANEMNIIGEKKMVEVATTDTKKSLVQSLDLGKLSYGQMWGIKTILVRSLNLDLIFVTAWLMPIVWSVILTLLLYLIGLEVFSTSKKALFFSWLSFLPFTWQFAGSMTLPNNWGFLFWLFFVLLLIKRMQKPNKNQLFILALFFVSSFFGYSLYFIMCFVSWMVAEVLMYMKSKHSDEVGQSDAPAETQNFASLPKRGMLIVLTALSIPIIELLSGYSAWRFPIALLAQTKQFVGNFLAIYIASGPRPHYILTGNVIFNQPPAYHFVQTFLTINRWWLVIFMLFFWCAVIGGFKYFFRKKESQYIWIGILTIGFLINYFVGRYVFVGEQVLSRRLDNVLAFFLLTCFAAGLFYIYDKFLINKKIKTWGAVFLVLIISLAISAGYSLGPANESVSENDYQAMQYVWQEEQNEVDNTYCVVADVYPLLALEQISFKQIVGGGFPINQYFAQPEREKFFKSLTQNADQQTWIEALDLTKTNTCFLVVNKKDLKNNEFVNQYLGDVKFFGDVMVWKYVGMSQSLK